jgi:hypothetical protein
MTSFKRKVALLLPLAFCACSSTAPDRAAAPKALKDFKLEFSRKLVLEDAEIPMQWLWDLSFLEDGTFYQCDIRARLLRQFDKNGALLKRVQGADIGIPDWNPVFSDYAGRTLYVVNRGLLLSLNPDKPEDHFELLRNPYIGPHWIRADSKGRVILSGLSFDKESRGRCLHVFENGRHVKSFHEAAPNAAQSKSYSYPCIALDPQGNIFAADEIDGILSQYSPDGVLLNRQQLFHSAFFRPFSSSLGSSPRDPEGQRQWLRTFTKFGPMAYLRKSGTLVIFERNDDPPERPSQIDLYTTSGKFIGGRPVEGFFVGADDQDNLYFCDQDRIIDGKCILSVYRLSVNP